MFKKFISYYRNYRGILIFDLFCALLAAGIDLLFPLFTREILQDAIPNSNVKLIIIFASILLGLYIVRMGLNTFVHYWGHMMGVNIEKDIRKELFEHYQKLDYQYYDDTKVGKILTTLTSHIRDIAEMAHHTPEDLFTSLILFIGSFVILLFINVPLTLILFALFAILLVFSITRRSKFRKVFRDNRTFHGELNSQIESSISGIRLTKAYANEENEIKKFDKVNQTYANTWKNNYKQMTIFQVGNEFLMSLMNLAILLIGGIFVINKNINLDFVDLTVYFLYINFFITPIRRLLATLETTQLGMSGFEKFYDVIKIQPTIVSNDNPITSEIKGEIEFKNVEFKYSLNDEEFLIKDLSFKVNAGETIALVGETGVGKTTISKLIPRFYDINKGSILIDGVDVKDYDLHYLRDNIGHVQQDVFIFYGTVKENIIFGKENASDEEIIAASKFAHIHDFISTLPNGYDTLVGERGVKLSGGQKQRLSIARLFLKNPKILILDEATSSLDNLTESQIQNSLQQLSVGKTTIIIAHRLSTIINSDEILVLNSEGITERGTHETLIENGGYYAKLYKEEKL